jgi:glucan biosynthesis protein C
LEPAKQRIYAFDTLRTIMVLLGIVIHAAIIYGTNIFHEPVFFNDPKNHSAISNVAADLIHIFRMPVFYTISGFFTAMLYFERGVKNMVSNRLHRLVYPFVVGLLVLLPMHIFTLNFFAVSLSNLDHRYDLAFRAVKAMKMSEISTAHLWFLYYLIWFCVITLLVGFVVEKWFPNIKAPFRNTFRKIFSSRVAPVFLTIPTLLCLYALQSFDVDAVHSFIIDWKFFLLYGTFFFFGWLCYGIKGELNRFEKQAYLYLALAFVLFIARWKCLLHYHDPAIDAATKSNLNAMLIVMLAFTICLFVFGIIGFFVRHFNRPSKIARYISDGSYWIYLIHMPLVLYIQTLLLPYDIPILIKFLLVLIATVLIAVLSYNYLVRNTFVGQFLNGRKLPRAF